MWRIQCFVLIICVILTPGSPTEYKKNGCLVEESMIKCKNAEGKFLVPLPKENIRFIYIMESNLTSLTSEDFGAFSDVISIEISNSVFSFPSHNGLFSMLYYLQDLKIEDCDVSDEVGAAFMENESLEWLSLRGNRISSITRRLVSNLTRLQELNLSGNNVSNVEGGALESLQQLRTLDLTDNGIDIGSGTVLNSRQDECTVCRPRGIIDGCSEGEVKFCHMGLPLDRLWWRSPGLTVRLNGNPACNKLFEHQTTKVQETETPGEFLRWNIECSVQEENCFYHQNRRLTFLEACAVNETNHVEINIEIQVEKVSIGRHYFLVLGALFGGIVLVGLVGTLKHVFEKSRKKRQRENKNPGNAAESRDPSDEESGMLLIELGSPNHLETSISTSHVLSAALEGDLKTLMRLKEEGIDLTMKNSRGESALWYAALAGQDKVVQFILNNYPEEVHSVNQIGDTPLHVAAKERNESSVKVLLNAEAKPSAKNKYGCTPLHMAVRRETMGIIELLLKNTECINETNAKGETPLSVAVGSGQIDAVKLLLKKGADVTLPDICGILPIQIAAWNGNETMVRLLLEKNSPIDNRDLHGNTALHDACRKGHTSIVQCLLEKGFDINACNKRNKTPLHKAVKVDHAETVELLLERGADVSAMNADGLTPLELARERESTKCIEIITTFLTRK